MARYHSFQLVLPEKSLATFEKLYMVHISYYAACQFFWLMVVLFCFVKIPAGIWWRLSIFNVCCHLDHRTIFWDKQNWLLSLPLFWSAKKMRKKGKNRFWDVRPVAAPAVSWLDSPLACLLRNTLWSCFTDMLVLATLASLLLSALFGKKGKYIRFLLLEVQYLVCSRIYKARPSLPRCKL